MAPDNLYTNRVPYQLKFSKYDRAILQNVWELESKYKRMLDSQQTYICSLKHYLDHYIPSSYPFTYEDFFEQCENMKTCKYNISYIFCSGEYLEDLLVDSNPPLAIQLRYNQANNFRYCLVRRFDRRWTRASMIASGAKEIE